MQGLAHERPAGHRVRWRRDVERSTPDHRDGAVRGFRHRDTEQVDRHREYAYRDEHDQRRGSTLAVAEPARNGAFHRIERDREDQRPDHQMHERMEYLIAEDHERSDQAGTDQHIQQALGQCLGGYRRGHSSPRAGREA